MLLELSKKKLGSGISDIKPLNQNLNSCLNCHLRFYLPVEDGHVAIEQRDEMLVLWFVRIIFLWIRLLLSY